MEPLQLGILAALAPPDVEVALIDDRCEAIPYDEATDLVCLTVETFTARRAYEIAAAYRKRGVPVAIGGMHPTLIPEEAAAHADAIVIGDAEPVFAQLVEDARAGYLQRVYHAPAPAIPQDGIVPRRDLFANKGYLPISLMQFSRGCKYACKFCASSTYFGQTQRCRTVEAVVREIEAQKRKLLFFVDDNIVSDFDCAKALFRALIPLQIRWVSQGSIDMLRDDELMRLMVDSGCLGLVIGFESIRADNLARMNKGAVNRRNFDRYAREIEVLRSYGLQTWAAFTLGHDGDTIASIHETCDFAIANKFTFAAFNILMPYPGTPLYAALERENRLLYGGAWWLDEAYRFNHCAFRPKQMSPDELTSIAFDCRKRFNHPISIAKRMMEPRTNLRSPYRLFTYLAYNPLFRKEVFKKQSLRFGLEGGAEGGVHG